MTVSIRWVELGASPTPDSPTLSAIRTFLSTLPLTMNGVVNAAFIITVTADAASSQQLSPMKSTFNFLGF